jgi:NTP pyrophosphatase (non-canonical NTP hydrolase)
MNQYRDWTRDLCRFKGWDNIPVDTVWLLFTEEIGELASAIRQRQKTFSKFAHRRDEVQNEMGDVFSYLFQLAAILDIDLDKMWADHMIKVQQKIYV